MRASDEKQKSSGSWQIPKDSLLKAQQHSSRYSGNCCQENILVKQGWMKFMTELQCKKGYIQEVHIYEGKERILRRNAEALLRQAGKVLGKPNLS